MKCPFCGGEMEYGALRIRGRDELNYAFVPPAADLPPETEADDGKLHILWSQKRWDDLEALSLTRTLKDRKALEDMFITGDDYVAEAWLCAKCGKALTLFDVGASLEQTLLPLPERSQETKEPPAKPEPPRPQEKPKPKIRRRSGKDPWDKGGPFGRHGDKPDWEL